MFTYLQIIGQVKQSNYPYYKLRGSLNSFTSETINIGDNLSESLPTVDSLLKSLEKHINICTEGNPKFIFELELFKKPSSNQGGKLGPFKFQVQPVAAVKPKETVADQNLMGLGNVQEHLTAIGKMNHDLVQPRIELERERSFLEFEKRDLARERKEFERFRTEKEAELKVLETGFTKKSLIAQNGFEKAAYNLIEKFTGDDSVGLGGTAIVEETIEPTKEEKYIESIALNILDNSEKGNIDLEGIKTIGAFVQKKINELKE